MHTLALITRHDNRDDSSSSSGYWERRVDVIFYRAVMSVVVSSVWNKVAYILTTTTATIMIIVDMNVGTWYMGEWVDLRRLLCCSSVNEIQEFRENKGTST